MDTSIKKYGSHFLCRYLRLACTASLLFLLLGCAASQKMIVRTSSTLIDGGVVAMDRESDLELAAAAIPAQLKLLEGMIVIDPKNAKLRSFAAQALYGYAFGFVELNDRHRASELYRRGFIHAVAALQASGVKGSPESWNTNQLQDDVARLKAKSIPALFWGASCLAKWIDMNRDSPVGIAELGNAAILMERVLELDEGYYHGSPHIFFGVYYGAKAPMFGGDYARSAKHFDRARQISGGKFLIADVMNAEFLDRQQLDQASFRSRLQRVLDAPDNLNPDTALANAIAKDRAAGLLVHAEDWF